MRPNLLVWRLLCDEKPSTCWYIVVAALRCKILTYLLQGLVRVVGENERSFMQNNSGGKKICTWLEILETRPHVPAGQKLYGLIQNEYDWESVARLKNWYSEMISIQYDLDWVILQSGLCKNVSLFIWNAGKERPFRHFLWAIHPFSFHITIMCLFVLVCQRKYLQNRLEIIVLLHILQGI